MRTAYVFDRTEIITLVISFFFSSRRRHTISNRDWSSDVCSSDLLLEHPRGLGPRRRPAVGGAEAAVDPCGQIGVHGPASWSGRYQYGPSPGSRLIAPGRAPPKRRRRPVRDAAD